jgi:hypothetical protein
MVIVNQRSLGGKSLKSELKPFDLELLPGICQRLQFPEQPVLW